ncbi:hypothetical protein OIU85_003793 [Salix viminalis]|uniref:RING-type E3 ubiquitin transferase n=1 Tax=Salix viminalis TaxID=40686 RepID=A0A9Q0Q057_SALVM|nr:hypothetical protein OIU85_003793 [Salix viminalis]
MVLSVLLCALICSLGLNSIIRCALRCSSLVSSESPANPVDSVGKHRGESESVEVFPDGKLLERLEPAGARHGVCNMSIRIHIRHCLIETCQKIVGCSQASSSGPSSLPVQETIVSILPLEPEGVIRDYRGK